MENISRRDMLTAAMLAAGAASAAAVPAMADEADIANTAMGETAFDGVDCSTIVYPDETKRTWPASNKMFKPEYHGLWHRLPKNDPVLKIAAEAPVEEKKTVALIVSSPTVGGHGDTIGDIVEEELKDVANVERLQLRDLNIGFMEQLGDVVPCADAPAVRHDAMDRVMDVLHRATAVFIVAPTYYNTIDSRFMNMLTRVWQPSWNDPTAELGPAKRVCAIMTCTGSNVDWLDLNMEAVLCLIDLQQSISAYRTRVYNQCGSRDNLLDWPERVEEVRDMARWIIE